MWTEERKEGRKEERERRPKKTIRAGAVERWKKEMGELGKRKVIAVVGEGRRREKKNVVKKKKEVRKEKRKKKKRPHFSSLVYFSFSRRSFLILSTFDKHITA